jgi:hypothetical protein
MPDFDALFAPDESSGPDFTALFAPDEKIPVRPELALKNAPKSAFNTAKRIAADILPGQHVQTGFALAQPGGLSNAWEGLKERFGGVENIKRTAEEDPVGLAYDATGLFTGGKTAVAKSPSTAMPRNVVRAGKELVDTGGLRMKIAKLDPAKVDPLAMAGPMQKFRDALKTEAIELGPDTPATLMNRIGRLEGAYTPNKRPAMANITKLEAPEKPPVSLGELHKHSQKLSEFVNTTGKTEGKINEQGKIAIMLRKSVDEMIDTHPESPSFKIGRNEVHRGKMSEAFDEIHKNASLTAMWRNGNEVAALQNAAANFLKAKKNKYAFTPEVRRKLERFSRDNKGRLLSAFGSKTVSGQAAARLLEYSAGYPGALWGPGMMAREARKTRMMDEWQRISEEIRAGGPVGN